LRKAVFDSSVLIAGSGWRAESHLCLVNMARRRARVSTSAWILEETRRTATRLVERGVMKHDPWPAINWFADTAKLVTPAPTGKQRSRDLKDDPIIGTALAAQAKFIVTLDKDLLDLEKPFGIAIVTPRTFLSSLQRPV
jgi:uncharacterized protein